MMRITYANAAHQERKTTKLWILVAAISGILSWATALQLPKCRRYTAAAQPVPSRYGSTTRRWAIP